MKKGFNDLKQDIISAGLCTTCGQCAGSCPKRIIQLKQVDGELEPVLDGECDSCGQCYHTCPGRYIPYPDLERVVFGRERKESEHRLGIWIESYRGHATDPDLRATSSSGGASSALIAYALDSGAIDGMVFASDDPDNPYRAKGTFTSSSKEYMQQKVNSYYSPVATNAALWDAVVTNKLNKVGLIGCGCHIQAVRKMQLYGKPKRLVDSIDLTIGLFCSSNYYFMGTEHLLKEFGNVELEDVAKVNYRGGVWPGYLEVKTKDGSTKTIMSKHDYSWHFLCSAPYKRDRCIMCPDFSAELSDISIGDIYVPTEENPRWAVILVRTERGARLVKEAVAAGYLHIKEHSPELIPQSGVGWEGQKHSSVFRLGQRKKFGWPVPEYNMEIPINLERRKELFFK
ncbi:Coenzyme F420 hydrogenase/dehydrogenase, beta subunit C-terminal domain [Candidatus Formimonas warabiya]|uniref:4Fe-4S ferredoxin-type domain-containing protein n=1 Tax=Formimonas warabiya TaxID=1761012 RepID=A0A3G1KMN5_FORW1|nr:Coenzyme F420 hydrogenase/dehydrogenase, beta subunit C-terminal domain [Candidatus Formimonas warabiya]ATW23728.1 hypothetical protein DCMF_01990 [Candidatus Formimonas warabiya]